MVIYTNPSGCMGVSDSQSLSSSDSSSSMEPWFCDACKAGVKPVSGEGGGGREKEEEKKKEKEER